MLMVRMPICFSISPALMPKRVAEPPTIRSLGELVCSVNRCFFWLTSNAQRDPSLGTPRLRQKTAIMSPNIRENPAPNPAMKDQDAFMPLEIEVEERAGRSHIEAADDPEECAAHEQTRDPL